MIEADDIITLVEVGWLMGRDYERAIGEIGDVIGAIKVGVSHNLILDDQEAMAWREIAVRIPFTWRSRSCQRHSQETVASTPTW